MYPGIFYCRRCPPFRIHLQLYIVSFWRRKLFQFLLELGQFFKCVLLAAIEFQQLGLVSFVTAWRQAAIKKSYSLTHKPYAKTHEAISPFELKN